MVLYLRNDILNKLIRSDIMNKLQARLLGAAGGAVALPVLADMARGVSFITEPMAGGDFATRYVPGLQMYADLGGAINKATGVPQGAGGLLTALGLAGAGSELGRLTMSETRKAPTIFKSMSGPGTRGFSISSGSSSSSVSSDIPLMLGLLGAGAGAGALGHKMLTKESMAKYYYSLS
jgi:hypothetical protein